MQDESMPVTCATMSGFGSYVWVWRSGSSRRKIGSVLWS